MVSSPITSTLQSGDDATITPASSTIDMPMKLVWDQYQEETAKRREELFRDKHHKVQEALKTNL